MKNPRAYHLVFPTLIVTALFSVTGCQSTSSDSDHGGTTVSIVPGENVPLHEDKDIQGVWLAPGFNFTGYDAAYVAPTGYAAIIRDNEAPEREFAVRQTQTAIVNMTRKTGLFTTVAPGSPTGAGKELRISNTIIKFEKGGRGARYAAGLFGAGQPHIRVRGQVYDGSRLVAVYEVERSGESGDARLFGVGKSNEDIIANDISDLAIDLADFFKRAAGKPQ